MTDQDMAILDFERAHTWWKYAGSKEREIRSRFDMSATGYYQRLVQLLAMPDAEAYDARTVRRLRSLTRGRSRVS